MLRRYNSQDLDTILLRSKRTTIGSSSTCDIVVKGNGISAIHASIEVTPTGFWLKEHSLSGSTKVNDFPVSGQIEIQSGDLLQIGCTPPFVFEEQNLLLSDSRASSAKPILPILGRRITATSHVSKKRGNVSRSAEHSLRSSASSTESSTHALYKNSSRSVGSNLLQRVVRLQAELVSRDEKIRQLLSTTPNPEPLYIIPHYRSPLPKPTRPDAFPSKPAKSFELCAYRAFISAIASQLRTFNERVVRNPQKEHSETFTAICRAVDIPLSSRITQIEKHCETVLIDNDFEEGDELLTKLEHFIRESRKEKIVELTNELDALFPIIRDAASNARENIKICNVVTQWSRQFGHIIRNSSLTSSLLLHAIDELNKQFGEAHMSHHWLPPSITPILRLAAMELERREGVEQLMDSYVMPRRKSIDENLDTCVAQVEGIENELTYHINRLKSRASNSEVVQRLDGDTVARISNVVESICASVNDLREFAHMKRVIQLEVNLEDIEEAVRKNAEKSDSDRRLRDLQRDGMEFGGNGDIEREITQLIEKMTNFMGDWEGLEKEKEDKTITINLNLLKKLIGSSNNMVDLMNSRKISEMNNNQPRIVINQGPEEDRESEEDKESNVDSIEPANLSSEELSLHSDPPNDDVESEKENDVFPAAIEEDRSSDAQDPIQSPSIAQRRPDHVDDVEFSHQDVPIFGVGRSHWRSHMNTASGRPNIVYQPPVHRRRFSSPPMKRRSKSEDQKTRNSLANRPPFVLY